MSISDESVEAAVDAFWRTVGSHTEAIRAALEAAAPHIHAEATADALRAAWDRGYATATDGMKGVPAFAWEEGYDAGVREERPGWTKNPYRPAQ